MLCCSSEMKSDLEGWTGIRVFLAVARYGSTLAASKELGMSQPTVARRIDALEYEIGLTLFERDTRGFHPTDAARALLPLAEAAEASVASFAAMAADFGHVRPIRITAYSGNFSPKLTQLLSEFSENHPEVGFEFLPSVKVANLDAGEADIALRITRGTPPDHLIQRRISTAQYALYCGRGYDSLPPQSLSLNELSGHCFVSYLQEGVPSALHQWLLQHVSSDQIVRTYSEVDLMHAAVRAGQGLGLINLKLAEADDALVRCSEPIEELEADHLMLVSPEAYRRPEVRLFTKFFAPRYAALFK